MNSLITTAIFRRQFLLLSLGPHFDVSSLSAGVIIP